ncbi:MAG: hypothetical protein AUH96_06830 [Nitrospirae bacterium 13_2_20CM_2_61_4]|nr:MAG: hypothetical protein AUH96_06830 [Nitrospirae bacterium 13_2_20CM_2_61_4]
MRTLRLKIVCSAAVAALYAAMLYLSVGNALFLEGHLIRISILIIIGVVYSVMSESLEQERRGKLTLIEEMNERRRAEEALKASETLLRALHEITVDTADWEAMTRNPHRRGGVSSAEVILNGRPNPERRSPSLLQISQTGVPRPRIL